MAEAHLQALLWFLRADSRVSNVRHVVRPGCPLQLLTAWEERNAPLKLPDDFKAFLLTTNGLEVRYDLTLRGTSFPVGALCVNGLANADVRQADAPCAGPNDDDERANTGKGDTCVDLDDACTCGRVAIVFPEDKATAPYISFQDLAGVWHKLADTFAAYYRLMVVHLGLPRWQLKFTPHGLDPDAACWHRLLRPEQLAVDLGRGRMRRKARTKRRPASAASAPPAAVASGAAAGSSSVAAAGRPKTAAAPGKASSSANPTARSTTPARLRTTASAKAGRSALGARGRSTYAPGDGGGGGRPTSAPRMRTTRS